MVTDPRVDAWRTIPEIVLRAAARGPEVTALSDGECADLSRADLLRLTRRGAGRLRAAGVRRADYVVVDTTSLTWTEAAVSYFAVTWLGAVAVMTLSPATLAAARERTAPAAAVTGGEPVEGLPTVGYPELAESATLCRSPRARPDDALDVVFTSGTTGTPKPVLSHHSQWTGSVRPEALASGRRRVVAHSGVPLGVSGGLHGVLVNHLARGVTSCSAPTAADLVERCRHGRVDELHVTPHAARGVVRLTPERPPWARRITMIRVVGGPLPRGLAEDLFERFPVARVVSLYGLTEGGSALCVRLVDRHAPGDAVDDSVGRPAAGTQVVALDAQGQVLPAGQVGELALRPAGTSALSYLADDPLNRDRFTRGWARTGDLGTVDGDGEVHLAGRVKELIFLRGGRLPPDFVEDILVRRVDGSVELAVVGLPTPGGWDRIVALLSGHEDDPSVMEAARQLREMGGPFRPHLVQAVGEIPRTPNGKPIRRLLLERLDAERVGPTGTSADPPRLNGDVG